MRLVDVGEGYGCELNRTPSPLDRVVGDAFRSMKPQTVGPSPLGRRCVSGLTTSLRTTSKSRDEGRPEESDNGLPSTSYRDVGVFDGAAIRAARTERTPVG